jgi:hypothetical protein
MAKSKSDDEFFAESIQFFMITENAFRRSILNVLMNIMIIHF